LTFVSYSYQQELPTRFKKDIIQEACRTSGNQLSSVNNNNDRIAQEGIQQVLVNIGASERVSSHDIQLIFEELGDNKGEIYSQKLMQLL
jgi:hypothetical protein